VRSELLQDDIRGYLEEDVWHKEDHQCSIVLDRTGSNVQVFLEAEYDRVSDVRPAIQYQLAVLLLSDDLCLLVSPVQECK
jgi:metal-responsive CopG/Arc/MetJ family transcriptional regulator